MLKNQEEREIEITLENGKTEKGLILFTFEVNGDNFVLYELQDKVYAAKVHEDDSLSPVEEDEWKLVEEAYNQYMEDAEREE